MSFTRIVTTEEGKVREKSMPSKHQHMSPEERARRKLLEAETARRTPGLFGALSPHRARVDQPSPPREETEETKVETVVRENPDGGETQGSEDPHAEPPKTDEVDEDEDVKETGRGKDGGTDSSDGEGEVSEDTPDEEKEEDDG